MCFDFGMWILTFLRPIYYFTMFLLLLIKANKLLLSIVLTLLHYSKILWKVYYILPIIRVQLLTSAIQFGFISSDYVLQVLKYFVCHEHQARYVYLHLKVRTRELLPLWTIHFQFITNNGCRQRGAALFLVHYDSRVTRINAV